MTILTNRQVVGPVAVTIAAAICAVGLRISFAEEKAPTERKVIQNEGEKKEGQEQREGGTEQPKEIRGGGGDRKEGGTRFNLRRPDAWASAEGASADGKSIDLVVKREGGLADGSQIHTFGEGTEIVVDGKPGGIEGVAAGATCKIWYADEGGKVIGRIEVLGREIGGRWGVLIRNVDPDKRTLTTGGENPANDQSYDVAKDAAIIIDGKPGSLSDLAPGNKIHLKTSADMATVIYIRQGRDRRSE